MFEAGQSWQRLTDSLAKQGCLEYKYVMAQGKQVTNRKTSS